MLSNKQQGNDYTISTVQKALNILKLFDIQNSELSLMEISKLMNMNKTTALRFVTTLRNEGFLNMDSETKKYSLGVILFHLGNFVYESMNIKKIAIPHLKRAADRTGMIVHLGSMQDDDVVIVEKVWPDKSVESIRLVSKVGGILPLHCTGMGKLLLSTKTDDEIRAILRKKGMAEYTPNTITDAEELIREIAEVRRNKYAFNRCEHEEYIMSLTYPIFDHKNHLVAAMSLAGVTDKFQNFDLTVLHQVLQETTASISAALGHTN